MVTSALQLGQLVATASISSHMSADLSFHSFVFTSVLRHQEGDWGEGCDDDRYVNDLAITSGSRIVSVYHCSTEHSYESDRIFIITEADRSVTTVLWAGEY
jgi:hypothetical protein